MTVVFAKIVISFEQGKFALVFYPMNRKTPKAVATIMA